MFFNKKKTIKLEVFGPSQQLIDLFPPTLIKNTLPDWYKTMPKSKGSNNVSHCLGLRELYSQGVMLPLWSDYEIDLTDSGISGIRWPSDNQGTSGAESHNLDEQAPNAWPGYVNIKFKSPWLFYCSEPIQWIWTQPTWQQKNPQAFTNIPGSTEFKYQNQTNINTIWQLGSTSRTEKLKAGDPMVHLIPITERQVELEVGIMTDAIYAAKFARWNYAFTKPYQRLRQDFEKREQ